MALNGGMKLSFIFQGIDKASGPMKNVTRNFNALDKRTKRSFDATQAGIASMAAGTAALSVGVKGMQGAFSAAMDAGKFEQQLKKVGLITRSTAEEMEQAKKLAIEQGLVTQFDPHESLQGIEELGMLGFTLADSMSALPGSLDFAAAATIKVGEASKITGTALRVFQKDASEAADVAGKLMAATTQSALKVQGLETALANASPAANMAGQSIEQTLVAIGLLRNGGMVMSRAGRQVGMLSAQIVKNSDAFEDMGVSITDSEGNFRNMTLIFEDLRHKLAEMDKVDAGKKLLSLVGGDAVKGATVMLAQLAKGQDTATKGFQKGAAMAKTLEDQLKDTGTLLADFKKANLDTLPGELQRIDGIVKTLKLLVGDSFKEMLHPVARFIRQGLERLVAWFETLDPEIKKTIAKVFAAAAAFTALAGAVLLIGGMVAWFAPKVAAMASAMAAGAPLIAGLGAALAGLVAIFVGMKIAFDRNIGGFADIVMNMVEKVKIAFIGLKQLISDGFIHGSVVKQLMNPEHSGVLQFLTLTHKWIHRVKVFFSELAEQVRLQMGNLREPINQMGIAWASLREQFANFLHDFDKLTPRMESVSGAASLLANIFTSALRMATNLTTIVMSVFSGVYNQVRETLWPAIELVMGSLSGLKDEIVLLLEEMGILGGSTGANADAWETFGEVLGVMMNMFIVPISMGIAAIIDTLRMFTSVIRAVGSLLKGIFKFIYHGVDGIITLLEGDFFGAMGKFGEAFKGLWVGIKDAVVGVFKSIVKVVDNMVAYIAKTILAIPPSLMSDDIADWAANYNAPTAEEKAQAQHNVEAADRRESQIESMEDLAGVYRPTVSYKNNNEDSAESKSGMSPAIKSFFADFTKKFSEAKAAQTNVTVQIGEEKIEDIVVKATTKHNNDNFGGNMGMEE